MAKEIGKNGGLHKIPLNDLIIIGDDGYCSFEYEAIVCPDFNITPMVDVYLLILYPA